MSAQTASAPSVAALPTITLRATAKIEAEVDIVTFYANLSERARQFYIKWDECEECRDGCTPFLRPLHYLEAEFYETASCSAWDGLPHGITDRSEVEDWDGTEIRRGGRWGTRTEWTADDYATLCAQVVWLAALDKPAEELAEVARVAPNEWDVPLFGDDEVTLP